MQHQLLTLDWPTELMSHPVAAQEVVSTSTGDNILFRGLRVRMGINTGKPASIQVCSKPLATQLLPHGSAWGCSQGSTEPLKMPRKHAVGTRACPRCMPTSTTEVQICQGLPPAVFQQTWAKGSAPGGSQGAVKPWLHWGYTPFLGQSGSLWWHCSVTVSSFSSCMCPGGRSIVKPASMQVSAL